MSLPVYDARINQMTLGATTIGGSQAWPFCQKDLTPQIALEICDTTDNIAPILACELGEVYKSPVLWAQKAEESGAQAVCLYLASIDPNGRNDNIEQAMDTIKQVLEAISLPLIIWGCGHVQKDAELFKAAIKFGSRIWAMGPVQQENHREAAAALKKSGIKVIASTPIDVNMAKQLNIMLENEGIEAADILIDPTVSAIGYGIEYCYSVIERIRLAALAHHDTKLQNPLVCNIGREAWKVKESTPTCEGHTGDDRMRAVMWEASSASLLATAGADLLILRSPQALQMTQKLFSDLTQ